MEKNEAAAKILQVAEKLFAEHGFEGTSTRALAAAAGVNLAMISYYFGSKEELFRQLLLQRMLTFREKIAELTTKDLPAWQKMETIIEGYVNQMLANSDFHQIIYRELSLDNSPMRESITDHILTNMRNIHLILEQGQADGSFRNDIDKHLLMATITGTIVQTIKSPYLSMKMIGKNPVTDSLYEETHKIRLKNYLKTLVGGYIRQDSV